MLTQVKTSYGLSLLCTPSSSQLVSCHRGVVLCHVFDLSLHSNQLCIDTGAAQIYDLQVLAQIDKQLIIYFQCPCTGPVFMYRTSASVHVQDQCPCTRSVSMYKTSVHVQDQCPCTGPVSMYKISVHVQDQCPCTRSVSMYKTSVHVQDQFPCTRPVSMYKTSVHVQDQCPYACTGPVSMQGQSKVPVTGLEKYCKCGRLTSFACMISSIQGVIQ